MELFFPVDIIVSPWTCYPNYSLSLHGPLLLINWFQFLCQVFPLPRLLMYTRGDNV